MRLQYVTTKPLQFLRARRADALRICLQSMTASLLCYVAMQFVDAPSVSWAVFSSLFTLQVNFDRSLRHGLGQMAGTVTGTVVGLVAMHLFPAGGDALARLAFATSLTCLASALIPSINYSIIVAAAIALAPSSGIAGAFLRAEAIILGAAIGIAVSVTIWPQFARSRAFGIMAHLLDDCRELLRVLPILGPAASRATVDTLHERFLRHLVDARAVCGEARIKARLASGPSLGAVLFAIETLWHGLVLLDRASESEAKSLNDEDRTLLADHVDVVRQAGTAYLDRLVAYMRNNTPLPSSQATLEPLADAHARVKAHIDTILRTHRDTSRVQALSALSFALGQIGANFAYVGRVLEKRA
jgi:hypothetical protein